VPAKNAKDFRGATLCAFASLPEAWHFFTASPGRLRAAAFAASSLAGCGPVRVAA